MTPWIALLICLAAGAWFCWRAYKVLFVAKINEEAFFVQIRKLIEANNTDRAIKLCNAEPNALFPVSLKHMLTRANRIFELELSFHEALFVLRGHRVDMLWPSVGMVMTTGLVFLVLASFPAEGAAMIEWPLEGFEIPLSILLAIGAWGIELSGNRHLQRCELHLVEARTLLYNRQEKHPPMVDDMTDMTEEELVVWRERMEQIIAEANHTVELVGGDAKGIAEQKHAEAPKDNRGMLGNLTPL
jgi:hypothetical protein